MSFQQIQGQTQAIAMLRNGLRTKRLSHAYLFSGPAGTNKRKTAMCFAQALFCTEREDDACGQCVACRKVDHGNHPDCKLIEPDGNFIKIEQIRELQRSFSYRSERSQYKIYLIDQAERMTTEAANSLLKFLEEPSQSMIAILISDNGHAVLPTLQSRSQWVSFVPLPPALIYEILHKEGHAPLLARTAAYLVSGVEAARDLLQLNGFAEMRNVVIKLMKEHANTPSSSSIAIQTLVMKTELSGQIELLLNLLVLWFKDMISIQSGRRDQVVFTDQMEWLVKQAYSRQMAVWIAYMEFALEARRRLRANVNSQLVLEQLFFRMQKD